MPVDSFRCLKYSITIIMTPQQVSELFLKCFCVMHLLSLEADGYSVDGFNKHWKSCGRCHLFHGKYPSVHPGDTSWIADLPKKVPDYRKILIAICSYFFLLAVKAVINPDAALDNSLELEVLCMLGINISQKFVEAKVNFV